MPRLSFQRLPLGKLLGAVAPEGVPLREALPVAEEAIRPPRNADTGVGDELERPLEVESALTKRVAVGRKVAIKPLAILFVSAQPHAKRRARIRDEVGDARLNLDHPRTPSLAPIR